MPHRLCSGTSCEDEGMYLWATHRGFGAAQGFTRDTEDFDYWVYDAIVRVLVAIFLAVT